MTTAVISLRPGLDKTLPRLRQMFREHLHVGQHRHEIRVPGPAGDHMLVHVVDDPGAGDAAQVPAQVVALRLVDGRDRKSTRLNSSHSQISYAVFCLKKKKAVVRRRRDWTCAL